MDIIEQGSEAWLQARLGKVTASRISDVVAKTKSGWGASRANYAAELIAERLCGSPNPRFVNDAMRWGTEYEQEAADAYAWRVDANVDKCGFVHHPRIPMSGASPDRLVDSQGLIEIKCPLTATHLDYLESEKIPEKYILQMQWQMACTGRLWTDFVSYDPRLPEKMRLHIQHVNRDMVLISQLESEVTNFLDEIEQRLQLLKRKYG